MWQLFDSCHTTVIQAVRQLSHNSHTAVTSYHTDVTQAVMQLSHNCHTRCHTTLWQLCDICVTACVIAVYVCVCRSWICWQKKAFCCVIDSSWLGTLSFCSGSSWHLLTLSLSANWLTVNVTNSTCLSAVTLSLMTSYMLSAWTVSSSSSSSVLMIAQWVNERDDERLCWKLRFLRSDLPGNVFLWYHVAQLLTSFVSLNVIDLMTA